MEHVEKIVGMVVRLAMLYKFQAPASDFSLFSIGFVRSVHSMFLLYNTLLFLVFALFGGGRYDWAYSWGAILLSLNALAFLYCLPRSAACLLLRYGLHRTGNRNGRATVRLGGGALWNRDAETTIGS